MTNAVHWISIKTHIIDIVEGIFLISAAHAGLQVMLETYVRILRGRASHSLVSDYSVNSLELFTLSIVCVVDERLENSEGVINTDDLPNLGFMNNVQGAFCLKQEARDRSLINWEEFVRHQVRAKETNSEAKRQFSVIVMNLFY